MKANKIRRAAHIPLAAYIEATAFEHGCHLVVIDITSSRQAQLDRQYSEVTLKIVVAANQLGVWEWDYGTKEIFWSLECWPILGIERLSTLLVFFLGLVQRQDRARVRKLFLPVQHEDKDEIKSIEYRIIRPDGALVWISSFTQLQFNDDGRPRCVIGTLEDITESKRVGKTRSMSR